MVDSVLITVHREGGIWLHSPHVGAVFWAALAAVVLSLTYGFGILVLKKIRKLYLFGLFLDHLPHPIGICLLWCWYHAVSVTMTPFEPRRCSNTALSTRDRLVCSVSIVLLSEFQDGFSNSVKDTLEFKGLQ